MKPKDNKLTEIMIRTYIEANRVDTRERNIRWKRFGYPTRDHPINNCPFIQRESYCHYLFPEYKDQLECEMECPCTHHELGTKKVLERIKILLDKG